jgi:hypothetical protein
MTEAGSHGEWCSPSSHRSGAVDQAQRPRCGSATRRVIDVNVPGDQVGQRSAELFFGFTQRTVNGDAAQLSHRRVVDAESGWVKTRVVTSDASAPFAAPMSRS